MFSGLHLSIEEVDLVLEPLVFARSNDYFQPEFDDEEITASYSHLREVADALDQRLSNDQESVEKLEERTVGMLANGGETTDTAFLDGDICPPASKRTIGSGLWWDLSYIKPGLTRDSIHRQVGQIVDQLGVLSSCSDCLDDRRRLQQAIYLLRLMAEIA